MQLRGAHLPVLRSGRPEVGGQRLPGGVAWRGKGGVSQPVSVVQQLPHSCWRGRQLAGGSPIWQGYVIQGLLNVLCQGLQHFFAQKLADIAWRAGESCVGAAVPLAQWLLLQCRC